MIQLQDISKVYQGKNVITHALNGITLSMRAGEYVCFFGKSGCGKTTLLNILGGMDRPTSGNFYYIDEDVSKMKSNDLARFRNREVGYIFQSFHLLPDFTALENVAMPLGYGGMKKKERDKLASKMLERVGLGEKCRSFPTELSGGEQQRVAIARALVHNPRIILCDEPTGNLDEQNAKGVIELIESMHNEHTILVLVTHDPELRDRADTVYHMVDGRIVGSELVKK